MQFSSSTPHQPFFCHVDVLPKSAQNGPWQRDRHHQVAPAAVACRRLVVAGVTKFVPRSVCHGRQCCGIPAPGFEAASQNMCVPVTSPRSAGSG